MYIFVQTCTNSVVLLCIFLKSCTTIKKLYNQRKCCTFLVHCLWLLISFTMLFLPKCTVFFQSCTNSVVLIYIFLKSCTMIKKLYNQRKKLYIFGHCPWLLISFTMVFVPKCTVFSKAFQILWSSYIYIFKKLYNH